MLAGGIAVVVVLAVLAALQMGRRRSHDDVHSVEGYHRKLHTLEEITVHPVASSDGPAHTEHALRTVGSRTVRLTDGSLPPPPPVPPPLVADPNQPVRFDDAHPGLVLGAGIDSRTANDGLGGTALAGRPDRAMDLMNRRPRRLGGPILAVAAVLVLIVVLILAGIHKTPTKGHHSAGAPPHHVTKSTATHHVKTKSRVTGTTTTAAPFVSAPQLSTDRAATYMVSAASYSVVLSATGTCWIDATNATTGAVLWTGELVAGEDKTVQAQGPTTIEVGAPANFVASINGQALTFPIEFQAPFTMHLVTPAS